MKKLFFNIILLLFVFIGNLHASPRNLDLKESKSNKNTNTHSVKLGIDVLEKQKFRALKGKRVGLLTHAAGVNSEGIRTADIFYNDPRVDLVALYSPEHGLDSQLGAYAYVHHGTDDHTKLPIYSLHGESRRASAEMLQNIDTMVVDLQDLGVRSYSYISCLRYTIEECFNHNIEVIVLDRPNPLGGEKVDGPIIDQDLIGYGGAYPVPYVHGLTIGELATMAKEESGWLQIDPKLAQKGKLKVIKMEGWHRDMMWPDTGLTWVATSPNIPDLSAVMGYPITGLGAEIGGLYHGIGSAYPFRFIQHPSKSASELESILKQRNIPGIDFKRMTVQDKEGAYKEGLYIVVTDWNKIRPTEISFHMMQIICQWQQQNPFAEAPKSKVALFNAFVGSNDWWQEISTRGPMARVSMFINKWERDAKTFRNHSKQYWLYN